MSNSPPIKRVMISSTTVDLPEHRRQAIDACLREGFFPLAMEHLPARDADAIRVSLEMVDRADIYLGVYAWRYGHIPEAHDISITEMEFDRAVERKIPILVFLIHKDHTLTIEMVEADNLAQEKLQNLKERATQGRGRLEFQSAVELRSHIIQSLSALLQDEEEAGEEKRAPNLHPINIIPTAPEPYIAHPYSLLQTAQVVGRQAELNLLTDWVTTNKEVPGSVRLFNVVAIGGMGKSALTWKWFNDIAPHELPNRAGWMWWSFYESDAHYENFIIRALAYTSGHSEKDVRALKAHEREDQLWRLLDERPFVLVLDGLERILLAYSRMDASRMLDDDLDEHTANFVARAFGLPESAGQSFVGKHHLRLAADQRAGQFLRRLAQVHMSRLLISTRLYPAELQADTGDPLPGCSAYFLTGLSDDDALNLWREFKVTGSREQLLPMFQSFGNYPLLIRALAGEVANYRQAPRDFDTWRAANPDFNPAALPLKNAKTHVLEYALCGLDLTQRRILHTLAAFRMPATWDTLRALLVQSAGRVKAPSDGNLPENSGTPQRRRTGKQKKKLCEDNRALDLVLTELEDRGLVGWDKQANRYDLHPIVRGVVWAALAPEAQRGLYRELHTYFDAAPRPPEWDKVESLEDLTPAVELFDKLIGLESYDDALVIFRDHLERALLWRLSASRIRLEMLQRLFPGGLDTLPRLETTRAQSYTLSSLAAAYHLIGEPGRSAILCRSAQAIEERENDISSLGVNLTNLSDVLWHIGQLREAESTSRRGLEIARQQEDQFGESVSLQFLGIVCAARGEIQQSHIALLRSIGLFGANRNRQGEGYAQAFLAERHLWLREPQEALSHARQAWKLAQIARHERDFIRAARLQGEATLSLGHLAIAEEHLHHTLPRARAVHLVEQELPALIGLAEVYRQQQQYSTARELLEQVWVPAERGPYPLLHADGRNTLARIERDEGHREAAIAAAARAYELAWCDGPPYSYHYGLTNAKQLLAELGAPEPQLPPFDESKFGPMSDVELNPKDEFWIDPAMLDSSV
jgi:tetratricopeptide (TPR) repeat protein